jgi:hypothetical protein
MGFLGGVRGLLLFTGGRNPVVPAINRELVMSPPLRSVTAGASTSVTVKSPLEDCMRRPEGKFDVVLVSMYTDVRSWGPSTEARETARTTVELGLKVPTTDVKA